MTSPLLWYLNRGTGVVLLIVFTATVVLGVLATGRSATPLWPRFVTQGLHRSLAALSVFMLVAHVVERRRRLSTSTSAGGRRSCRSGRPTSRCGWRWVRCRSTCSPSSSPPRWPAPGCRTGSGSSCT